MRGPRHQRRTFNERGSDRAAVGDRGRLARAVAGDYLLDAGDLASLRRMDPRKPAAVFFKLEGLFLDHVLPGDATAREDAESRWAAVVAGLARLGSLNDPTRRLGNALWEAGLSDARFSRLLRADTERLLDDLPALARYLAAKRIRSDWSAAASLMLSAGTRDEERVRRHLARDYYGARVRDEKA